MIDAALEGWREGTEMERGFFEQRAGVDGIGAYVRSIRQRLGWISTSAVTMLMTTDRPSRAQVLRQAYGTFLCGLQCRDDAWDADEDRVTRGASVHEALGLPRGALTRAAPRALGTAAEEADRGGFSRLAAWVRSYCAEVDAATREPLTMVGAVGAMMIGEGVCRLDDAIEVPRVSVNPSATSRNNQRGGAPWR